MGFFDTFLGLAEVVGESVNQYVLDKSTDELCNSINSDSITSRKCEFELSRRLKKMTNRELLDAYEEYCSYSSDRLINIFESEMKCRGMRF